MIIVYEFLSPRFRLGDIPMLATFRKRLWRWRCAAAVCAALVVSGGGVGASMAAETAALPATLQLVPDDAAFYDSMLRNREQVEAVASSRAWAKLKSMPVVQMGLALYNMQAAIPQSPPAKSWPRCKTPKFKKPCRWWAT